MMWKVRRTSKDKMSTLPSDRNSSSSTSSTANRNMLPKKTCLRGAGDSLDSDYSSAGSGASTQRSETYNCDHSSGFNSSSPSKGSSSSERSRNLSHPCRSLDARVSKSGRVTGSSHVMETSNRSNGSRSTSSSQRSRGVRFSSVEIREYERQVGDNPSCSSGPPIGIGWTHLDTRVVHLNHYEMSRPYRKGQLEMTLTREEREALLTDWGVSPTELINSTRALNKAKNQRRQTVRNLDKAQRVEESIESVTRKLKRVLTRKPSTSTEVEELQRQAQIAAALSPARFQANTSHEDDLDSERRPGRQSVDNSKARTMPTTPGSVDDTDAISCISGYTLGNTTTASVREIERFHRELEFEMFGDGDQDLPSMVGQTLEVDVDIPEEEKVFDEPAPYCGTAEPPSVAQLSYGDESTLPTQDGDRNVAPSIGYAAAYPVHVLPGLHHESRLPAPTPYGSYPMVSQGSNETPSYDIQLGNSLDRPGFAVRTNVYGMGRPEQVTPPGQLIFESRQGLREFPSSNAAPPRPRLVDSIPYASPQSMRRDWHCSTDGPRVTHMPWMEGPAMTTTHRRGASRSSWEAVTISEDDLLEAEMEQYFVEQRPEHTI